MLCLRVWGGDLLPSRGGEPRAGSGALTSTSQRALELVADVADWRSVVRRNTCSLPLYSSHVRNFSCSAWNSRTTSPCRQAVGSGWPGTLPADEPPRLRRLPEPAGTWSPRPPPQRAATGRGNPVCPSTRHGRHRP